MNDKALLEKEFFARIPKARKINPFFRSIFEFMYKAHMASLGKKVLNIYCSEDMAGKREEVYKDKFFNQCDYDEVDFWANKFIYKGKPAEYPHILPLPDEHYDLLVTTKYIMEHIFEPEKVIREFYRILKPDGEAFVVAAHVRRQHQKPHDYLRYTEFGLEYLFKKAGFREVVIAPTNGCMGTFGEYAYFLQRGLRIPKWLERVFDFLHYWVVQPVFFFLDWLDNGYGRDMTQYFLVRAKV